MANSAYAAPGAHAFGIHRPEFQYERPLPETFSMPAPKGSSGAASAFTAASSAPKPPPELSKRLGRLSQPRKLKPNPWALDPLASPRRFSEPARRNATETAGMRRPSLAARPFASALGSIAPAHKSGAQTARSTTPPRAQQSRESKAGGKAEQKSASPRQLRFSAFGTTGVCAAASASAAAHAGTSASGSGSDARSEREIEQDAQAKLRELQAELERMRAIERKTVVQLEKTEAGLGVWAGARAALAPPVQPPLPLVRPAAAAVRAARSPRASRLPAEPEPTASSPLSTGEQPETATGVCTSAAVPPMLSFAEMKAQLAEMRAQQNELASKLNAHERGLSLWKSSLKQVAPITRS
ncbi:hypothetical protein KFE25_004045 [Diacronema lutheri]|uniref:Uncharacterized protein n=2 Tax=Diacronema lutheri TaxID=2081491 RepID=A0A8J5XLE0_DIALT|nr:hypothetical protein KFE25_004045 [Diacronema lutheri]